MRNKYKIPWHIRQYVKRELMDYKSNKLLLDECKGNTRGLLLANKRLTQIDSVIEGLNKEDKEAFDIIFTMQYSQVGAEMVAGLSKAMYYNAMNKIIYLTAKEFDLI